MATCKDCGAAIPEDATFCVACGKPAEQKKKGILSRLKLKKTAAEEPSVAETSDASVQTDVGASSDTKKEKIKPRQKKTSFDSEGSKRPFVSPDDMNLSHSTTKPSPQSSVFIPKVKNNWADKTLGLVIFLVIAAYVVFGFIFNPSLTAFPALLNSLTGFSPLLLLALAMLIPARTGNFDFSLPGIMTVTCFLLMSGYNDMNYYSVLIICIGGAICIGLISGLLTALFKIPSVFSGLVLFILEFFYLDVVFSSGVDFSAIVYTAFSKQYLPISLIILSAVAVFVLIYLTKLGRPLHRRKGLTTSTRLLYVFCFALASALAAGAGAVASITSSEITADFAGAAKMAFDYTLGVLFIIAIAGSSSLFDNRFMPIFMVFIGFFLWFGIDVLISGTLLVSHGALVAFAAKVGFVVLALSADRVYSKAQIADFYQTIHVKQ